MILENNNKPTDAKVASVDAVLNEQSYERNAREMSVRVHSICTNLPSRFLTHAQDVCAYEINIDRLFLHHRGDSRSFERSGCLCVCECVCAYAWLGAPFINKS